MSKLCKILNLTFTSALAMWLWGLPAGAVDMARLTQLHAELLDADPRDALRLAKEIELEWSKSGSSAMDLLLRRGTDALDAGEAEAAIEHLTALTDHAPDFAEGWHRRSLAFAALEMYGPAVADIERTLALMPQHYDAIATLGGILVQINKPDAAIKAFEQVLAIHPHHAEVTEALEHLKSQAGSTDL